jgi:hypothetical protein
MLTENSEILREKNAVAKSLKNYGFPTGKNSSTDTTSNWRSPPQPTQRS